MPGTRSGPRDRNESTRPGIKSSWGDRWTKSLREGTGSALRKKAPGTRAHGTGLPDTFWQSSRKVSLKKQLLSWDTMLCSNRLGFYELFWQPITLVTYRDWNQLKSLRLFSHVSPHPVCVQFNLGPEYRIWHLSLRGFFLLRLKEFYILIFLSNFLAIFRPEVILKPLPWLWSCQQAIEKSQEQIPWRALFRFYQSINRHSEDAVT